MTFFISSRKRRGLNTKGFTIIELLIATAIFSVVLLIALGGFSGVGRLFYKGVSASQTQIAAENILTDVSTNIQSAANVNLLQTYNNYSYYCIGGNRYTVKVNQLVLTDATPNYAANGNFGLLKDNLSGGGACAPPCVSACASPAIAFKNPTELLGSNMRLGKFQISQPDAISQPNLYNIKMIMAYGDDGVVGYSTPGDYSSIYCIGNSAVQRFCAVHNLTTNIYKGLHP
jgi:prepilin-type N-terminal cleavage/methylation domain-containing protein